MDLRARGPPLVGGCRWWLLLLLRLWLRGPPHDAGYARRCSTLFLALCARVRPMFGAMLGALCATYVHILVRCDVFRKPSKNHGFLTWPRSNPAPSKRTKHCKTAAFERRAQKHTVKHSDVGCPPWVGGRGWSPSLLRRGENPSGCHGQSRARDGPLAGYHKLEMVCVLE